MKVWKKASCMIVMTVLAASFIACGAGNKEKLENMENVSKSDAAEKMTPTESAAEMPTETPIETPAPTQTSTVTQIPTVAPYPEPVVTMLEVNDHILETEWFSLTIPDSWDGKYEIRRTDSADNDSFIKFNYTGARDVYEGDIMLFGIDALGKGAVSDGNNVFKIAETADGAWAFLRVLPTDVQTVPVIQYEEYVQEYNSMSDEIDILLESFTLK